ncbi:MAG: carbohydrate kinase family protein [Clostridia bacterium]|nr:carbohydrate kinase family protein [Clostridia bacterium]
MNKRVLVLSSAYMCLDAHMPALPAGASEREGDGYNVCPGGKGLTAALTFRAMGLDSILCAGIGDDEYGRQIDNFLMRTGVDRRFIKKCTGAKTGLYLSLHESDRGPRMIKFRQANGRLTKDDIEAAFMVYPDALYIQNELPFELSSYAVNVARSKGVPVFWQPCAVPERYAEILPGSFEAVIFDANEVSSYCGVSPDGYDKFLAAAMALSSHIKSKYIIIRLPDRGAFIYDGLHHDMAGEYPSTYLDETGSSVVYGAAFISAYLKTDGNVKKAAKCAAAAYAYSSSNKGDVSSVPSVSDLVRFLKKDQF